MGDELGCGTASDSVLLFVFVFREAAQEAPCLCSPPGSPLPRDRAEEGSDLGIACCWGPDGMGVWIWSLGARRGPSGGNSREAGILMDGEKSPFISFLKLQMTSTQPTMHCLNVDTSAALSTFKMSWDNGFCLVQGHCHLPRRSPVPRNSPHRPPPPAPDHH